MRAKELKIEVSGTKISFHIWPLDPGPSRAQAWAFMGPPPSGDDNADGGGGGYGPKHWRPLKKGPGPGTSIGLGPTFASHQFSICLGHPKWFEHFET